MPLDQPKVSMQSVPRLYSAQRKIGEILDWVSSSHLRAGFLLLVIGLGMFTPGIVSLQPMDRDEPRFAQASKQMVETGDLIDIRFQSDSRYKKPVGIYWLQAASVATAEAFGVVNARGQIFFYRLPSLMGALAAVLLTYWTALAFVTRRNAFIAAAAFASCLLVGVEARLAKTDAMLLATVLFIMGQLARAWLGKQDKTTGALSTASTIAFWSVMGVSILIKGPLALMIAGLAALTLSMYSRSGRWLLALRPILGLLVVCTIVLPWLIAIVAKTGTAFFDEAVGKDMLGKVAGSQERHGAPPGTYLGVFWATFWPVAPYLALALPFVRANLRDRKVLFLLAWIIPSWLVFEAVPTKLPHYVLPLYPAIAILIAMALQSDLLKADQLWKKAVLALVFVIPAVFLIGLPTAFVLLDHDLPSMVGLVSLVLATFCAVLAWQSALKTEMEASLALAIAASLCLTMAAYPFGLPKLQSINLSRQLADAAIMACAAPDVATTGYREPSLVFLTSTDLLMSDGAGAARFMSETGCRVAFVEKREEPAFFSTLGQQAERVALIRRVQGLNINSGRKLDIGVYRNLQ